MRALALAVAAAALLLAACGVDTEGAPCAANDNCPAGQGCGANLRCSAKALACTSCRPDDRRCADDGAVATCVAAADAVCSSWSAAPCSAGQVCGDASSACVAPYALALSAPAANALVGLAGVDVVASVTLASANGALVPVPSTLPLLADGAPVGALARTSQDGLVVRYGGLYTPPVGVERSVQLSATAGSGAALASAAVPVQVETTPPVLSAASVACDATPCLRDGVLTVSVTATDARLDTVSASLDLDGNAKTVALSNGGSGATYSGKISLTGWPFPFFSHAVSAKVTARDLAGNVASVGAAPVNVTRLRWQKQVSPQPITAAAVEIDGSIAVAGMGNDNALYRVDPSTGVSSKTGMGVSFSQPPAVGAIATWLGADNGQTVGLKPDWKTQMSKCPAATNSSMYTPVLTDPVNDLLYAGANAPAKKIYYYANNCVPTQLTSTSSTPDAVTAAMTVAKFGTGTSIFAGTAFSTGAGATVRRLQIDPQDGSLGADPWVPPLHDGSAPPVPCDTIAQAVTIDGRGHVLVACQNSRQVHDVDFASQTATFLATLSGTAGASIVLLPSGDLILVTDDQPHALVRLSPGAPTRQPAWTAPLDAAGTGAVILAPGADGVAILAVTAGGTLHAMTAAGVEVWAARGADALGTEVLRFPSVVAPAAGAPSTALPTAYVPSKSGTVYAVVVDTPLDATSPWPKPHHDLRNSGNASFPLP
jgi:hypothetical protein